MAEDEGRTRQTVNSVGVITADGQAKIQVGNSYVTIHNYPDPSRYPADSHLAEPEKAKLRTKFLQRLRTSPYEDRKNRNPRRADGTCEWFTSHPLFQNWRQETSSLLWVSADPGCGKSVLARYLVDDVLPSSTTRTTCYFFFKDDYDDQKVLEGAFCCLLHQLFTQRPALLSDKILEDFREEGDHISATFSKLWGILIEATRNQKDGEIICVIDALDECVGQKLLAEALTKYYSKNKGTSTLKFLVTSRPYLRIQQVFQDLEESQPTIHLSGENEEEVDKISQEITICIEQRIEELCKRLKLDEEGKKILYNELATGSHRTYLWVYLVFAALEEAVFLSKDDLRTSIRNLPSSVEEAYERILLKSRDPDKARKILHIVVAAERPLHLEEMAVALAFRGEGYRCYEDLERDLLSLDHLHIAIRENCGLFVVIQDSQIFLLHQTAREFLVRLQPKPSDFGSPSLTWQHSLDLEESHHLLSEICIKYLLLDDFNCSGGPGRPQRSGGGPGFVFLGYAASNWPGHYRQAHNTHDADLELLALQLCDTDFPSCRHWLKACRDKRILDFSWELPTSLLIASYFGLDHLVKLILQDSRTSLSATGVMNKRTALSWASEKGYDLVVQSLLDRVPKHQVLFRDSLLPVFPTIINRKDGYGKSPLCHAAANGHRSIVQQLLDRGANVDTRDETGLTPLSWATLYRHSDIVALLLKHGARQSSKSSYLETRDRYGWTVLMKAAKDGNDAVVKLLLDSGANVNARDKAGVTALCFASHAGAEVVVKLLLGAGAKVDVPDEAGRTALGYASLAGWDAVVKLLLDAGAKVDGPDKYGRTALYLASSQGYSAVVKLLLDGGANVHASEKNGWTAIIVASMMKHEDTVKVLVDGGAMYRIENYGGKTQIVLKEERTVTVSTR